MIRNYLLSVLIYTFLKHIRLYTLALNSLAIMEGVFVNLRLQKTTWNNLTKKHHVWK